jgi:hypothetical protein
MARGNDVGAISSTGHGKHASADHVGSHRTSQRHSRFVASLQGLAPDHLLEGGMSDEWGDEGSLLRWSVAKCDSGARAVCWSKAGGHGGVVMVSRLYE